MRASYRRVDLVGERWMLRNVAVAGSFCDRMLGIHRAGSGATMLRTRSVHTWTLRKPILAVAVDAAGVVRRASVVKPRSVFTDLAATWIVECPHDGEAPVVGSRLRIVASCPDAGNADCLRDTDREPR